VFLLNEECPGMMITGFPVLDLAKQGPRLAHNSRAVMAQVGWVGHTGSTSAMADMGLKTDG
jgi:hypothetical protein